MGLSPVTVSPPSNIDRQETYFHQSFNKSCRSSQSLIITTTDHQNNGPSKATIISNRSTSDCCNRCRRWKGSWKGINKGRDSWVIDVKCMISKWDNGNKAIRDYSWDIMNWTRQWGWFWNRNCSCSQQWSSWALATNYNCRTYRTLTVTTNNRSFHLKYKWHSYQLDYHHYLHNWSKSNSTLCIWISRIQS